MESSVFRPLGQNVVKDEEAPAYFSQRAIWLFSGLFGVFFGSILMGINLNKTDTKKGILLVTGFGVVYTIFEIWPFNTFELGTPLGVGVNFIGATVMQYFFWDKYIGADTLYRAKPVLIPSIVGVCILALFIVAIIYGGGVSLS